MNQNGEADKVVRGQKASISLFRIIGAYLLLIFPYNYFSIEIAIFALKPIFPSFLDWHLAI